MKEEMKITEEVKEVLNENEEVANSDNENEISEDRLKSYQEKIAEIKPVLDEKFANSLKEFNELMIKEGVEFDEITSKLKYIEDVNNTYIPLLVISKIVFEDALSNDVMNIPEVNLIMHKQILSRIDGLINIINDAIKLNDGGLELISYIDTYLNKNPYKSFTDNLLLNDLITGDINNISDFIWLSSISDENCNNFFLKIMQGLLDNDYVLINIPASEGLSLCMIPMYYPEENDVKVLFLTDKTSKFTELDNEEDNKDKFYNKNIEFMYKAEYYNIIDAISHIFTFISLVEDYKTKMASLMYTNEKEFNIEEKANEIIINDDIIVSFNDYIETLLS